MPTQPKAAIGRYHHPIAVCRDYDPRAPEVARLVRELIVSQLPTVSVEHVGSTAVEDCAGKGIIDLMVLYPEGQLEPVKTLLETLGFQRQSTRNPFPEERPMRVGSLAYQGTVFQLHVHVITFTSPEALNLRAFRDALQADANLRAAYIARKRAIIAAGITKPVDYSIAKGEFVQESLSSVKSAEA